jgi:hypothetical protein
MTSFAHNFWSADYAGGMMEQHVETMQFLTATQVSASSSANSSKASKRTNRS